MPMVIRGPVGGGNRGGPFHSQNIEMAFFHTPGLKIVYPSTAYDAKGLIKAAIRDDNPVIFEEHKGLYRAPALREVLPAEDYIVPLGEARTVLEGEDLTIVTYGAMVHKSVEAARTLEGDGVGVEVIDLRTLLPLDEDAIVESVKRTGRLLVVHEDTRTGGIAGEIASLDTIPVVDRAAGMIELLGGLNLALFLFNLIPLMPLDGGHVAGAIVESIRRGFAKLFGRPDPGPVDTAKLIPVTLTITTVLALMSVFLIFADIVNPVSIL